MLKRILILTFSIWPIITYSQTSGEAELKFDYISTVNGLSSSGVQALFQDRKGFLWIGTWDGLNRYDGYNVKQFRNDPKNPNSIGSSGITAILEDSNSILWFGTNSGLSRFDPKTETFKNYVHNSTEPNSIANGEVRCIALDPSGNLWVGTRNGLDYFDQGTETFTHYTHNPDDSLSISENIIRHLLISSNKELWVGTYSGIDVFNRSSKKFTKKFHASDIVNFVEDTVRNTIWVATNSGFYEYNLSDEKNTKYLHDPSNPNSLGEDIVNWIIIDRKGVLWLGLMSCGLDRFLPEEKTFLHYIHDPYNPFGIGSNCSYRLLEDNSDNIWIGNWGIGLSRYSPKKYKFPHVRPNTANPKSLGGKVVTSVCEDSSGTLWIGTKDAGLYRKAPHLNTFTAYRHDEKNPRSIISNHVNCVTKTRDGAILVGTQGGLSQYNAITNDFTRKTNHIQNACMGSTFAICEDIDGSIWFGGWDYGVIALNLENGKFRSYKNDPADSNSLSNDVIWWIFLDFQKTLWIGTRDGLNKYNRASNNFTRYFNKSNPQNLQSFDIGTIYESSKQQFWLGTHSSGLVLFDRKRETYRVYDKDRILSDNVIQGILEDNHGRLWLSSGSKGLSVFDPLNETCQYFLINNGLQSSEFHTGSVCKTKDGLLIFGGSNGYNIFDPESIRKDTSLYPILITDFQLFNKSVRIGDSTIRMDLLKTYFPYSKSLQLNYNENFFTFEFSSLDYTAPEMNQYAYKMEGFDKVWNFTNADRRYATYTNLNPGKYRFSVKGSNSEGFWNDSGTCVDILIKPPFWDTLVFKFIFFASIALLIGVYILLRLKRLQENELKLQKMLKERTQQLEDAQKSALINAHKAGQTDSIVNILHNAGNIMNNITVSGEQINSILHKSSIEKLDKLSSVFIVNQHNNEYFPVIGEKGKLVIEYFHKLSIALLSEYDSIKSQTKHLLVKLNTLRSILNDESEHLEENIFKQDAHIPTMIDEVLMNFNDTLIRNRIEIVRDFQSIDKVYIQKIKLTQVITCLVTNAIDAVINNGKNAKTITCCCSRKENEIHISIADSGCGIESENLQKIFSQGFSTKASHNNISLHESANFIAEMGGRIWAKSEGINKGCIFHVQLQISD